MKEVDLAYGGLSSSGFKSATILLGSIRFRNLCLELDSARSYSNEPMDT